MGRTFKASFRTALLAGVALTGAGLTGAIAQDEQPAPPPADTPPAGTEVITVRGAFIPNEKRNTSEISSLIDSQDFAIAGDSDAAAALTRLTGVTVQGGRFVYVRGLSERYTSATLNGSPLPSPEPLRRIAPLDLFPTSVLSNILVQKTFSPEYSAEFGGGSVDMRTIAVPNERFLDASVSVGFNDVTTMRDGLMYDGSDGDWTGFDDGKRNYPAAMTGVLGFERIGSNLTNAQRAAIGEELVLDDTRMLVQQRGDISPDGGASLSFGDRFDLSPNFSFGVVGALGFDSNWETREGVRRATDSLGITDDYRRRSSENTIESNALVGLGLDIADNHTLQFTGLGTRSTAKEARSLDGFSNDDSRFRRVDTNDWFERQVWIGQLTGAHTIPFLNDLSIDWRTSYSEAFRDSPFETDIIYSCIQPNGQLLSGSAGLFCGDEGGSYMFSDFGSIKSNVWRFSKIEDDSSDYGVDFSQPFDLFNMAGAINFGASRIEKNRYSEAHIYSFAGGIPDPEPATAVNEFYLQRVDALFSPSSVGPGQFDLVEVGGSAFPDAHTASLEVDAFYAGVDIELTSFIRAAIGARYEDSIQQVNTFNIPNTSPDVIERTINFDPVLPAATITWNFTEDMQLRIGASQTITRPEFRELAYFEFLDTDTDTRFNGNPFLTNSRINNFDARWEYYFGRDQFITAGVFYKEIKNPIEEYVYSSAASLATSFINAPLAELQGIELEFEKVFDPVDFGFSGEGFLGRKFYTLRSNYTYTDASVSADGFVTTCNNCTALTIIPQTSPASDFIRDGRQLQGQSEHVFNLSIGYEDPVARTRATLLYNYASERIRAAEKLGSAEAVIEQPPSRLDFTYARTFDVLNGEFELGFKAQNLLGEDYEASQEVLGVPIVVDGYNLGRVYGLSLTARY